MPRSNAWLSIFRTLTEWSLAVADPDLLCVADDTAEDGIKCLYGDVTVNLHVVEKEGERMRVVLEWSGPAEPMPELVKNLAVQLTQQAVLNPDEVGLSPLAPMAPRLRS